MRAYTWQSWLDRNKSQFPQVDTDLRNGTNAVWVMTHADEKKKTYVLFWDGEAGPLSIYGRRSDWDCSDNSDVLQPRQHDRRERAARRMDLVGAGLPDEPGALD
jgi:hypothetical protein